VIDLLPLKALRRAARPALLRVPLPLALEALAWASHRVPPRGFMPDFVARALALAPAEKRDWFERAWWGQQANALVGAALVAERHAAIDRLVDPTDFAAMERAAGAKPRGLLFVGAHLGPLGVAPYLVARRFPDLLVGVWSPQPGLPGVRVEVLANPEARRRFLVEALRRLRGGGQVFIGADGRSDPFRAHPFLGGTVKLSCGPATLARVSGAATFAVGTAWSGRRLALRHGPVIDPEIPRSDAETWETAWQRALLAFIEEHVRHHPESVGLRKITVLRSYRT